MCCRAVAVLFVVAACGFPRPADVPGGGGDDGDDGPATPTCMDVSGTRIKLTVRQASDGTKQVIGLFDSMRNEACRWTKASDGQLRCMPVASVGENYSDGYVAYAAAGCTTPILGIFGNRTYPGKPFLGRDGADVFGSNQHDGCEGVTRMFAVGALLPAPTTVWIKDPNGACVSLAADTFFYDYYAAGAETPASTFAAGSTSKDGTARVWLETITGSDGSHSCGDTFDLHDSAFGDTLCNPANYAYDEKRRCMPSGGAAESLFTDNGCTAGKLATRRVNCRPPATFATSSMKTATCGYGSYRVRAVGEVTTALFRKDTAGVCQGIPTTYTTYSVEGEFIPEEMFPEVTYAFSPGGSRLMRRDLVTGGARVSTDDFRDMQLDTPCRFELGADGVQRCTPGFGTETEPVAEGSYQVFTTADCSGTPGNYAIVFPPYMAPCAQLAEARYARVRDASGYNSYTRIGNGVPGTFSYKSMGSTTCSVLQADAKVYQLGANIMSELVTATEARQ